MSVGGDAYCAYHDHYDVYDYYYDPAGYYYDDYSSGVSVFGGLVVGWCVLSAAFDYDFYYGALSCGGELGCVCVYVAGGGHDCGWWVV